LSAARLPVKRAMRRARPVAGDTKGGVGAHWRGGREPPFSAAFA
jgi:hypothetical protein